MMDAVPQGFAIVRDADPVPPALRRPVLAIGNFDGVHRGHRAVIDTARALARRLGRPAAAMTFEPHPRKFFQPDAPSFRLSSEAGKLRLLAAAGLEGAAVLGFDAKLAALTAEQFIDEVLVRRFGAAGVVVGFNFHFGQGRIGSPQLLRAQGARRGFAVEVVQPFEHHGRRVSSGAVRDALAAGKIEEATDLLGHPWFVTARVEHGDKRGRDLGYPTANMRLGPECGLKPGIYAVRVGVGGARYDAVASFGRRPMFDNGALLLEVYLFDFKGDLYGAALDVAFVGWIRPEMTFDGVDALIARMDQDSRAARTMLARAPQAFPPLS